MAYHVNSSNNLNELFTFQIRYDSEFIANSLLHFSNNNKIKFSDILILMLMNFESTPNLKIPKQSTHIKKVNLNESSQNQVNTCY